MRRTHLLQLFNGIYLVSKGLSYKNVALVVARFPALIESFVK